MFFGARARAYARAGVRVRMHVAAISAAVAFEFNARFLFRTKPHLLVHALSDDALTRCKLVGGVACHVQASAHLEPAFSDDPRDGSLHPGLLSALEPSTKSTLQRGRLHEPGLYVCVHVYCAFSL